MAENTWLELIRECESLVRAGKIGEASLRLAQINRAQVPRVHRLPLSRLCRRTGLVTLGLRLLTPVIHANQKGMNVVPTQDELAEYAVLLQRNGSVQEALTRLRQLSPEKNPEILLYRAYCLFPHWRYEDAIADLKVYVGLDLPEYQRQIGKVNLAAALVMTGAMSAAENVLGEILDSDQVNARLRANAFELRAQIKLDAGSVAGAEDDLRQAEFFLDGAAVHDVLFVRRWRAVIEALKKKTADPLKQVRELAQKQRHWETIRDIDLEILRQEPDHALFQRLYFGTPFPGFRERIRRHYEQDPGHAALLGRGQTFFDVSEGLLDGRQVFKRASKLHQLVNILVRDLYRPYNVGRLFSELFPDEHFNVFSSPDRIHQILRRVRMQLARAAIPLEIAAEQGHYSLSFHKDLSVVVTSSAPVLDWFEVQLARTKRLGLKSFSQAELCTALEMSGAEYRRFMKWAEENGKIRRVGGGRSTRHLLAA